MYSLKPTSSIQTMFRTAIQNIRLNALDSFKREHRLVSTTRHVHGSGWRRNYDNHLLYLVKSRKRRSFFIKAIDNTDLKSTQTCTKRLSEQRLGLLPVNFQLDCSPELPTYYPSQQRRWLFTRLRKTSTVIKAHERQDYSSDDLQLAHEKDVHNLALAARYGLATLPLAALIDGLVSLLFSDVEFVSDDKDLEYVSNGMVDLITIVFSLHMGWSLSCFQCLRTLHKAGDPLSSLAERWSKNYQQEYLKLCQNRAEADESSRLDHDSSIVQNSTNFEPSFNKSTEAIQADLLSRSKTYASQYSTPTRNDTIAFMSGGEFDEARERNYKRIYHSYHAGLYGPLCFLMGSVPFLPLLTSRDLGLDSMLGQEDLHYPTRVWEDSAGDLTEYSFLDAVLHGYPTDWMDYSIIGLCAAGCYMFGKRAYASWKLVQVTPPTSLPSMIHLRASAVGLNKSVKLGRSNSNIDK